VWSLHPGGEGEQSLRWLCLPSLS